MDALLSAAGTQVLQHRHAVAEHPGENLARHHQQFGARLVASPRHADALLVTGVVTHNMAGPLRTTVDATPRPRRVIACGDCALDRGVFREAYGAVGAVGEVVPVDVEIPGCPPTPGQIVAALRSVTGK